MKRFTMIVFTILACSPFSQLLSQMSPARSDSYQGTYNIRTGYGPNYGLKYNPDGTTYTGTESAEFIIPSIHFQLYNGLKLQSANPTANTTTGNTVKSLKKTGATAYPYFNQQPADAQGNRIFNWTNWMYPFTENGIWPYAGTAANRDGALFFSPWRADVESKRNYKDYNNQYYGNINWFTMATNSTAPTMIYNRINQQRDKIIISLWVGYMSLDMQRQNPMMDLRVSNLDAQTKLYTRTWFSNPDNADVGLFGGTEYNKIRAANTYWQPKNNENGGLGRNIADYNADMDGILHIPNGTAPNGNYGITARTEGASEITGVRTIAYNNDPDPCNQISTNVDVKFRALTIGGYGAASGDPNASLGRYYHPGDPYQLSEQYFLKINISRPVIAFSGSAACASAPSITSPAGKPFAPATVEITDNNSGLLPGTETSTKTTLTTDASRVRVSLVLKADYEAAVANGTIGTNNDLPVVSGFAYLSPANFEAISNTIPRGDYFLKYDYSAPDSKTDIKTAGDKLGEVFAKSIYQPLNITEPLPVTFDKVQASITGKQLNVNWSTVMEKGNSHFFVEVSSDGVNFKKLKEVETKAVNGNSDTTIDYYFSTGLNTVFGLFGIPALLGLALAGYSKRRKIFAVLLISGLFIFSYSCNKNQESISTSKEAKIFVRIAQVDKDGTTAYSKVVQAVRE